jgi:LPS export ABC transporter permease LptF/LPS export ABC transporter permease LptG
LKALSGPRATIADVTFLRDFRPTIIDRYVLREITPPTALGLLLFTFILLLQQITILTGALISRSAPPATIVRVFVYLLPSMLSVTIPMAFLLGVLLAFGRLAADSEIVALRATGVSPSRLLRPVLAGSLVTGLLTFWIMAVALPAANQAYREIMFSLVISRTRSTVKPRVFTEDLLRDRTMTLYVSDISSDTNEWKDVFIHDTRDPKNPRVILARTGGLVIDEGARSLEMHLEHGVLHACDPAKPEAYDQQRFRTLDLPLPFEDFFPQQVTLAKGGREMTLAELTQNIHDLRAKGKGDKALSFEVERHKKFAIPMACVVFGLLGLGLSLGARKEARSAAFGLSIVVIFVYYVFIRLGQQAGDTGLVPPSIAIWSANVILGLIAIALLVANHRAAAFDPLDPSHYTGWIPRMRRAPMPAAAPAPAPRPPGAPSRQRSPAVVVRVPRLSFGFPSILDRYIAVQYLGYMVLVGAAFWALFILAHFLDLFDDIQQHKVRGKVVLHFYAFYTPEVVHLLAPVAVLVATLATFGILSRRNEITAMKAGGISIYRATLPAIVIGFAMSASLFAMGEFILPQTNLIADQDLNVIKGRPPRSSNYLDRRWMLGSDGRLYNYDYALPGPGPQGVTLFSLTVYDIDNRAGDLRDRLYAARAEWQADQGAYDLERGWHRGFGAHPYFTRFTEVRSRELEPPSYFRQEERGPDTFRFGQLRDHIAKIERLGLDAVRLRVQLHRKPAFPTVAVVMTLIAIPFSFVVGRRGALYGIFLSILIAIAYHSCLAIFEALGNNALLPAILAAWAPNILFGAAGLYMMLTLET